MYIFPLKNLDNFTPLAQYVRFSTIWFIKKDKIERLNLYRDKIITSTFLLFSLRMLFTFGCENNFLIQYMINLNIKHILTWTITKKKISPSLNKNFKHCDVYISRNMFDYCRTLCLDCKPKIAETRKKSCEICKISNILESSCLK